MVAQQTLDYFGYMYSVLVVTAGYTWFLAVIAMFLLLLYVVLGRPLHSGK